MDAFISGIVAVMTGVFTGILEALSGIGSLLFTMSEAGAITGITGFGYFMVVLVGIPLGTWLVSKVLGLVNKLRAK